MKIFNIGDYEQIIYIKNRKIIDASCTCTWGTIHRDAFESSKTLCKHLKEAILKCKDYKQKNGKNSEKNVSKETKDVEFVGN